MNSAPRCSDGYRLIVADPPWDFRTYSDKGRGRDPARHYHGGSLNFDALCALPIAEVAARDAVLALWVTGPLMFHEVGGELVVPKLFKSWGFRFSTMAFTWVKETKRPQRGRNAHKAVFADGHGLFNNTGYATMGNCEFVVLCRRGKGLPRLHKDVNHAVLAPFTKPSEKPEGVQDGLERLYGSDMPKLELFGRRERDGWVVLGDEVGDRLDIRESLRDLLRGK